MGAWLLFFIFITFMPQIPGFNPILNKLRWGGGGVGRGVVGCAVGWVVQIRFKSFIFPCKMIVSFSMILNVYKT